MKHFAIRSRSVRREAPFTCPGLGDRIHSALLAWQWSKGEPVTIHITDDKWSLAGGVLSDKKKKSWAEICKLFPGDVKVMAHNTQNLLEEDWLHYLEIKGYAAQTYYYEDSLAMHPLDYKIGVDATGLLHKLPEIKASRPKGVEDLTDSTHIAYNLDSTDANRMVDKAFFERLTGGLKTIKITGDMPLDKAGYIISTAKKYIGIDSGIFHLATLYKSWKDIELLSKNDGYKSHHLIRAIRNGTTITTT